MSAEDQVNHLLRESGARLIRDRKHEVWRLPNGRNFVRAKTTSDCRSERNNLSDLRRALGIEVERGQPGERREKVYRPKQRPSREFFEKPVNNGLADQLRLKGVAESALREELELVQFENASLKEQLEEAAEEIEQLESRACACLWCRARSWTRRALAR